MLEPTSPNFVLSMAIALLIAVGGAVGLAVLSDQLDHTLQTPEDIERRLGLPMLVSIPRVKSGRLVTEGGL